MKMNLTISQERLIIKKQTFILNDDIINVDKDELFQILLDLSTIIINNKDYLPLLFQQPRKINPLDNKFNQTNSWNKETYVNLITLDYDNNMSREYIENKLSDYNFISYYSYSNEIRGERFRVLLFIDSPVEWDQYTSVKKQLIEYFECSTESFSSGFMYLPAIYDGTRFPKVRKNDGIYFDLFSLVEKCIIENKIRKETRTPINNNIINEFKFNTNRQEKTINESILRLESMGKTGRNAVIQSCISRLAYSGVNSNIIEDLITPYETRVNKIPNWIKFINECCSNYIPISYFNRYEFKKLNEEYYVYDNELSLYKDEVSGKWLNFYPRNSNSDLIKLTDTNLLFRYLYNEIGNLKEALKLKMFIELIINRLTDKKTFNNKYQCDILEGVPLTHREWRVIGFNIFKFRDIFLNKKKNITEQKNDNILDVLTIDFTINNEEEININTKILNCLSKLILYRYDNITKGDGKQYHYFTPTNKLMELVDAQHNNW